ncbi:hypothetical protein ACPC54_30310 [Kitasatospora sp. NPDC094028]
MSERRPRREHPAPLPGIARIRVTGDDQAVAAVLQHLADRFVVTGAARYPGGRAYLEADTRPPIRETHDG